MKYYEIEPVDTLFFRDGRPYNMDETQNDVKSVFPPSPYTVAGALRAALARKMGWTGGKWNREIIDKIGDGNDLGPLRFFGPYLKSGGDLIFTVPSNLLAQKKKDGGWDEFRRLRPGQVVQSDMGSVLYPVLEDDIGGMKNIQGYLRASDMATVLWEDDISGIEPIAREKVWRHEFSVGIKRNIDNLTVEEGRLFSREFVRLGCDTGGPEYRDVRMVAGIDGIEEVIEGATMLGGESKAAFIRMTDDFELPAAPGGMGTLNEFVVVLITPARINSLEQDGCIDGLPDHVKLVSACVDRPDMIGGWDFRKGPLPLMPHLRAGSVLFCSSDEGISPVDLNGLRIGHGTEFGLGQILIGKW